MFLSNAVKFVLFTSLLQVIPTALGDTASASADGNPLLVNTTSGKVLGYLDTTTTSVPLQKWYGVRFAQDTSGANRWQPPQPFFDGKDVFNASAFGPACLQGRTDGGNGTSVQSEDCLRVNVIAPVGAKDLPVYVYSLYETFSTPLVPKTRRERIVLTNCFFFRVRCYTAVEALTAVLLQIRRSTGPSLPRRTSSS